jgi:hypothetical protein
MSKGQGLGAVFVVNLQISYTKATIIRRECLSHYGSGVSLPVLVHDVILFHCVG